MCDRNGLDLPWVLDAQLCKLTIIELYISMGEFYNIEKYLNKLLKI